MRRLLLGLATALVLSCGLTPAVAAPAPPRTEVETANQVDAWIGDLARWSGGYIELVLELGAIYGDLNEGIATARTYFERGDTEGGGAWAREWGPRQHARIAALKPRLAALAPRPPEFRSPRYDLTAVAGDLAHTRNMFEKVPGDTRAQIESAEILSAQVIDVIERAAAGERTAAGYLTAAYFDLNIASMQSDNRSNDTFIPLMERRQSAKGTVLRTSHALNESLIEAYKVLRAFERGAAVDRKAAAASIRLSAGKIDAAARDLTTRIRVIRADIYPGELGRKSTLIAESYDETLVVMTDLAGRMRSLADTVERGGELDYDGVLDTVEAAGPSIERFYTLDDGRRALLVQ